MANSAWANIPQEFARSGVWAVSTLAQTYDDAGNPILRGGKPVIDKAPRHPKTGLMVDMNQPETWATFEECAASGYPAIGRLLQFGDGFTVIDLDAPPDGLDASDVEKIRNFHTEAWNAFPSYTELSQSGTGYHIVIKGGLNGGYRQPGFEVYGHQRYMITTGDVVRGVPIAEYQTELDELAKYMAGLRVDYELGDDVDDARTPDEIIDLASRAKNGEKFKSLFYNPPAEGDDWSLLDAALVQMIAFWTKSHRLGVETFARSALWRGDGSLVKKRGYESPSKYVHDYLLNRTFARAWNLRARDEAQEAKMAAQGEEIAKVYLDKFNQDRAPEEVETVDVDPYDYTAPTYEEWNGRKTPWPEKGLLRDVAQYVQDSAAHPVGEVALGSAIVYLSGIVGRQFHTYTGSKLTHYVTLVMGTAKGKDAAATGLHRLTAAVEKVNPFIREFEGPGQVASGQALVKELAERPSCFSILGEFGHTLQKITSPTANMADKETKRVLLDTYTSTRLTRTIYADKDKSAEAKDHPNFCFLGDTTPELYYASIDEDRVAEGFIPRLLELHYDGPRTRFNSGGIGKAPPDSLVQGVAELLHRVAMVEHKNPYWRVGATSEAKAFFERLNNFAAYQINKGNSNHSELWSRNALKVLRGATLAAVCELGPGLPIVELRHMQWAHSVIWPSTEQLLARFKTGEVGSGEVRFESHVVKAVKRYMALTHEKRAGYKVPDAVIGVQHYVPFTYLRQSLRMVVEFKNHRLGVKRAIEEAVADTVQAELLTQLDAKTMESLGLRAPVFMPGPQFPR